MAFKQEYNYGDVVLCGIHGNEWFLYQDSRRLPAAEFHELIENQKSRPDFRWIEFEIFEFDSNDNTYYGWPIDEELRKVMGRNWVNFEMLKPIGATLARSDSAGMVCIECKNGYPYAEPNYNDDKLVCWSCCDSLGWKYGKDKQTKKVTLR